MTRKLNFTILALSLLGGILFNWFFYDILSTNALLLGISYPLFVIFLSTIFFVLNYRIINWKSYFAWFLLIISFCLSATYAIFNNTTLLTINWLLIPILLLSMMIIFTRNNAYQWFDIRFISELFPSFFIKILENFLKPIRVINQRYCETNTKTSTATKIFFGVIISIPLLVIIISLLASADEIFKKSLGSIPEWLDNLDIASTAGQALIILFATFILSSIFWSLLHQKHDLVMEKFLTVKPDSDAIVAITILALINLVYIFFVVIQFSYLFSGADLSFLENFTYAKYARKGFNELIIVTIINLTILIITLLKTKYHHFAHHFTTQLLQSILIILTGVILYSSYFRLSLYQQAYGYTYSRLFALTVIILLLTFIIFALLKVWNEKTSLMQCYIVIALLLFTGLNYINIDKLIAKENIDRFEKNEKIDLEYLSKLSVDALPELNRLPDFSASFKNENYVTLVHQIDIYLGQFIYHKNKYGQGVQLDSTNTFILSTNWQSYNLNRAKVFNKYSN